MELVGANSEEDDISRNRIASAEKRVAATSSGRQNRPMGNRNLSFPDSDCQELNSRGLKHLLGLRVQPLETPSFYFTFSFDLSFSIACLISQWKIPMDKETVNPEDGFCVR